MMFHRLVQNVFWAFYCPALEPLAAPTLDNMNLLLLFLFSFFGLSLRRLSAPSLWLKERVYSVYPATYEGLPPFNDGGVTPSNDSVDHTLIALIMNVGLLEMFHTRSRLVT